MSATRALAQQFREVYLEGKWVANTNLKEQLINMSWEQATTKIGSLNTIAQLVFHLNYYVAGVSKVFEGGSLDIRDKYSFDMTPLSSEEDWQNLLAKSWQDAEKYARLVEELPEEKLDEAFVDPAYGTYRRNIHGMIEHCYYHFGQVVLLRKMIITE